MCLVCGGPSDAIAKIAVAVRNRSVRASFFQLDLASLSWGLNYSIIHSVSCCKWRAY